MIETRYIPDSIGDVAEAVNDVFSTLDEDPFTVYYDYGHISEIVKNLTQKENGITEDARQKYPMIWLVMDFEETVGRLGIYSDLNLNLIITTGTSSISTMQERRDATFLPILYPIYAELLNQFEKSKQFQSLPTGIPHTKIDRPYWGGNYDASLSNIFNDMIDAVQIRNLKIQVKNICVTT